MRETEGREGEGGEGGETEEKPVVVVADKTTKRRRRIKTNPIHQGKPQAPAPKTGHPIPIPPLFCPTPIRGPGKEHLNPQVVVVFHAVG